MPQGFVEAIAAVDWVAGANGEAIVAGALGAPKPPKPDMMFVGGDAALGVNDLASTFLPTLLATPDFLENSSMHSQLHWASRSRNFEVRWCK